MAASPADMINSTVQELLMTQGQLSQVAMLYAEKDGGFQCGTCRYAMRDAALEDGKAYCRVTGPGIIDLNDGCCVAWRPDLGVLQISGA